MSQWFTKSPGQVLSELGVSQNTGLTSRQGRERLEKYGPNRLAGVKKEPLAIRFLNQMKDPMIIVLLIAAALSLASSGGEDWIEALIILVIVVVNACISISQENSAEKALEALRKMSAPLAKVIRDGKQIRLETDALVPGDIIVLEAGDLVPAFEIMHVNNAIRSLIRDSKTHQIDNAIAAGGGEGMITMDQSLLALYKGGEVTAETALAYADNPDQLKRRMG